MDEEGNTICGCPQRHIPYSIIEWWELYNYEKEFGSDVKFAQRSVKYLSALSVYNSSKNESNKAISETGRADSLTKLKVGHGRNSSKTCP